MCQGYSQPLMMDFQVQVQVHVQMKTQLYVNYWKKYVKVSKQVDAKVCNNIQSMQQYEKLCKSKLKYVKIQKKYRVIKSA